jgi:hypothetical protein
MPTTTIKSINEIRNYSTGTLMFPSDYHDGARYYDIKAIKKKYGFHSRSKIAILHKVFTDDDEYRNAKQNKDNKYKDGVCCLEECEGAYGTWFHAYPSHQYQYVSDYPYGDVLIFGETKDELIERQNKMNEEKRMKKVRKEFMKKLENCDEKMICMLIDRLEELEEENNK